MHHSRSRSHSKHSKDSKAKKVIISICFFTLIALLSAADKYQNTYDKYVLLSSLTKIPFELTSIKLSKLEINSAIKVMNKYKVSLFYSKYTKDADIAFKIIERSIENDVPINLSFAIAYKESRFDPNAYNKNDAKSIDRGIFQLNNLHRPHLKISDFYNIDTNIKEGITYLKWCLDKTKTHSQAIIAYNAGLNYSKYKNYSKKAQAYINDVISFETELDIEFNKKFPVYFSSITYEKKSN